MVFIIYYFPIDVISMVLCSGWFISIQIVNNKKMLITNRKF